MAPIDRTPHFGEIMQKPEEQPFPRPARKDEKAAAEDGLPEIDPETGDRPQLPRKPQGDSR